MRSRESVLPALESSRGHFQLRLFHLPRRRARGPAAPRELAGPSRRHAARAAQALRQLRLDRLCRRPRLRAWGARQALSLCGSAAHHALGGDPMAQLAWFQWAPVVAWLGFLFEYLFGVCMQIYLILLAYAWVRGITFTHSHLLDFAIRRCSFVLKWALVVMLLSSVFIDLPLILKNFAAFRPGSPTMPRSSRAGSGLRARCSPASCCSQPTVQITLVFHSESLRKALRDHVRFVDAVTRGRSRGSSSSRRCTSICSRSRSGWCYAGSGEETAAGVVWTSRRTVAAGDRRRVAARELGLSLQALRHRPLERRRIGSSFSEPGVIQTSSNSAMSRCASGSGLPVSADFAPGRFHVLVGEADGESNALLRVLGLLDLPESGEVFVEGRATRALDDEARAESAGAAVRVCLRRAVSAHVIFRDRKRRHAAFQSLPRRAGGSAPPHRAAARLSRT